MSMPLRCGGKSIKVTSHWTVKNNANPNWYFQLAHSLFYTRFLEREKKVFKRLFSARISVTNVQRRCTRLNGSFILERGHS